MMWTIALRANFKRNKYLQFGATERAVIACSLQFPLQMQTGKIRTFCFFGLLLCITLTTTENSKDKL